jgi:hypothetical protein
MRPKFVELGIKPGRVARVARHPCLACEARHGLGLGDEEEEQTSEYADHAQPLWACTPPVYQRSNACPRPTHPVRLHARAAGTNPPRAPYSPGPSCHQRSPTGSLLVKQAVYPSSRPHPRPPRPISAKRQASEHLAQENLGNSPEGHATFLGLHLVGGDRGYAYRVYTQATPWRLPPGVCYAARACVPVLVENRPHPSGDLGNGSGSVPRRLHRRSSRGQRQTRRLTSFTHLLT